MYFSIKGPCWHPSAPVHDSRIHGVALTPEEIDERYAVDAASTIAIFASIGTPVVFAGAPTTRPDTASGIGRLNSLYSRLADEHDGEARCAPMLALECCDSRPYFLADLGGERLAIEDASCCWIGVLGHRGLS